MSGSSGSGGGASGPEVSCDRLVINTMLASPRPDMLDGLYPGQVLDVRIQGGTVVVVRDGNLVGGLASPLIHRLRTCMLEGTQYRARVVAKNGALVRLQVSPVSIYS